MPKTFHPTTPGRRHLVLPSQAELTRKNQVKCTSHLKPPKSLLKKKKSSGGRNNLGRITCRHRGGGHRRHYRQIDFRRDKEQVPAKVAAIQYDPNRTCHIALLHYADGEKRYILAPRGLKVGDQVISGIDAPFRLGCSMPMRRMPLGSIIHNVELFPGRGGQLVRSAGTGVQLRARADGYVTLKLPSGEVRLVHEDCRATFGSLSNAEHLLRREGKAGRNRWKGIRPTVRGTAMNPVDHPNGGGEGRQNSKAFFSPWGWQSKGYRTRRRKKSRFIIKDRRKK